MTIKKEPARNASHSDAGGDKKLNREVEETLTENEAIESPEELGEVHDRKEQIPGGIIASEKELREKIEAMDMDENLKFQVKSHAQQVKLLQEEEEKLKRLLEITRDKGVVYAVAVAKKMDDAYVLDKFHDLLAEKGFYKKFIK